MSEIIDNNNDNDNNNNNNNNDNNDNNNNTAIDNNINYYSIIDNIIDTIQQKQQQQHQHQQQETTNIMHHNASSQLLSYQPALNTLCDFTYKYTLISYKEYIKTSIANYKVMLDTYTDIQIPTPILDNSISSTITNTLIDNYLLYKIKTNYMPYIKTRITAIENIPVIEQKTPEWFKMRESMISASDAGYFLNKCGLSKAIDALKIKIGLKHYTNSNAPPLMHGNTYEDVARAIYESRHKVRVFEYGIITSPTHCIGASPDGIVGVCLEDTIECQSKYGRLLEIKNPYSRCIDNSIKPEYMVQILQQQYTTGIPICDFVETTIVDKYCRTDGTHAKPYITINDMLNDKLEININSGIPSNPHRIKNKNIPYENLTKFGNEKGLLLWFQCVYSISDTRHKYIVYPLHNQYNIISIEKWIGETKTQVLQSGGYMFKEIKYWRLDVYSEKTVIYDQSVYETEYIPTLCKVWDIIEICRKKIANGEDINKYVEDLETTQYINKGFDNGIGNGINNGFDNGIDNGFDNPFYNAKKANKKLLITTRDRDMHIDRDFVGNEPIKKPVEPVLTSWGKGAYARDIILDF